MCAIVGTQPVQTLATLTAAHYTGFMSSIDDSLPSVVRVGRDPGAGAASTRASVAIGFGSPAGDTGVTRLDLNDILVRHPQATFLMRIAGDAMREVGIDSGDLVLVDRAIAPSHGHVVIAVVDEEFVCRQLCKQGVDIRLQATHAGCADILAREGAEFQIWGVVTQVIKSMSV
jgi:DNA polymerase V